MKNRNNLKGLIFVSPWIIGFLVFYLYPILISFYYSFTDFNVFQAPKFTGLKNYRDLFIGTPSELFYKSLFNTLYMTVFGTLTGIVFGLIMALLLNQKVKALSIYRTAFYIPSIVPQIATVIMWLWILNSRYGFLNALMKTIGLPQPNWLQDPALTKPSLLMITAWSSGTIMIIFLAAIQDVPRSLYEAAEIDGAGSLRKFWNITMPGLSPVILYQLIMGIIFNFQDFTRPYLITSSKGGLNIVSGGPENSLLFYSLYLFHNGFIYFKMGLASAMAWILFLIVALVTWLILKFSDRWVVYGGE